MAPVWRRAPRPGARATPEPYPGQVEPVLLPLDLGHRLIPYDEAWQVQERVHAQVVSGEAPPTILLLEHSHVYTAGKRTEPGDLPPADEPLVVVNRGGRITWHGPGQVVAYPIVPLRQPMDVMAFVCALEDALIDTCAEFGLPDARRIPGRSGVWICDDGERKVAAIGVRVARGVAMHGVALNVDCDLAAYSRIVPCGIVDAGVTSMAAEGADLPADAVGQVAMALGARLREVLSWS